MQTDAPEYVVVRKFHLGGADLNLSVGERVSFDGNNILRHKTGKTHEVPSFTLAIQARHVVQDTGDVEFKPRSEVLASSARPAPKVIVEDREERVVGRITLPNQNNERRTQSTEEVARTTAETAQRRVVVADQRVVGRADVRTRPSGPVTVSSAEASATAQQQAEEARPVGRVSRAQSVLNDMLRQEGLRVDDLSGRSDAQVPVIMDASEGEVVGRVKSLDERKADLVKNGGAVAEAYRDPKMTEEQKAALEEDTKKALAKRAGVSKTATEEVAEEAVVEEVVEADVAELELNELGYPVDFPHNDHWRVRLQWCVDRADQIAALQAIYANSTSGFRNQLQKAIPSVAFEE